MLTILRAERADRLVEALASVIAPAVLAIRRGAANVEFPFPGRLVGAALAAATDVDPDDDPWLPERAVWPLMAVVDDHLGGGWMAALAAHLGCALPD
jgi:hypothetical protein